MQIVRELGLDKLFEAEEPEIITPVYPCVTRKMTAADWKRYGPYNAAYDHTAQRIEKLIDKCNKQIDTFGKQAKVIIPMRCLNPKAKRRSLLSASGRIVEVVSEGKCKAEFKAWELVNVLLKAQEKGMKIIIT